MITCHAAVVEHDLDPGLSDLKEGCSFPSALSRLHGEGQDGPPQKWELRPHFRTRRAVPILLPELPAPCSQPPEKS